MVPAGDLPKPLPVRRGAGRAVLGPQVSEGRPACLHRAKTLLLSAPHGPCGQEHPRGAVSAAVRETVGAVAE